MTRAGLLVCAAACLLLGCGSEVRRDGSTGSSSSASGTTASASGSGGGSASSSSGASVNPCVGKPCGSDCAVCNDVECLEGECDDQESCRPWFEAPNCSGGGGSGGVGCPPADQVLPGVPCPQAKQWCPSESSCSGYLSCESGSWTLINPC
jgi:hypothetical protein